MGGPVAGDASRSGYRPIAQINRGGVEDLCMIWERTTMGTSEAAYPSFPAWFLPKEQQPATLDRSSGSDVGYPDRRRSILGHVPMSFLCGESRSTPERGEEGSAWHSVGRSRRLGEDAWPEGRCQDERGNEEAGGACTSAVEVGRGRGRGKKTDRSANKVHLPFPCRRPTTRTPGGLSRHVAPLAPLYRAPPAIVVPPSSCPPRDCPRPSTQRLSLAPRQRSLLALPQFAAPGGSKPFRSWKPRDAVTAEVGTPTLLPQGRSEVRPPTALQLEGSLEPCG